MFGGDFGGDLADPYVIHGASIGMKVNRWTVEAKGTFGHLDHGGTGDLHDTENVKDLSAAAAWAFLNTPRFRASGGVEAGYEWRNRGFPGICDDFNEFFVNPFAELDRVIEGLYRTRVWVGVTAGFLVGAEISHPRVAVIASSNSESRITSHGASDRSAVTTIYRASRWC